MIAVLNDHEVKSGDILNAYAHGPIMEKMCTTLVPELSKGARKNAVIVRALNGPKSAGAALSSHLAKCIESMRYQSCKADLDLWFRPEIRPDDMVQYYSYLL